MKPGHETAQRCWSNHLKAKVAWMHFHSLALTDTISTRLCPHRDTRAETGAHGQQSLALLRIINHVLFDPSLSRAAAEGCAYRGMCCAFSAFQLCQDWWQETQSLETQPQGAHGHNDGQSPQRLGAVPRLGCTLSSGGMQGARQPWRCSLILAPTYNTCWKLPKASVQTGNPGGASSLPLAGAPQRGNRTLLLWY